MKKIVYLIILVCVLQSCSLFTNCKKYKSDNYVMRTYAQVESTNMQLARDKALFDAKINILMQIDDYILENYPYKNYLKDPDYEKNVEIIRTQSLKNCEVICEKCVTRGGKFYASVAIQLPKDYIKDLIKKY